MQRAIALTMLLALGLPAAGEFRGLEGDLHQRRAREVMADLDEHFWLRRGECYAEERDGRKPAAIWGGGIMFSALVGGARHDEAFERRMHRYFRGLERYWDEEVKVPGYEPYPTRGGGNDKYYDDNAWMVLTFLEAYELSDDRRYLRRAEATLDFVLSGWDDAAGGGIWWHEGHKDGSKNTCVNAPAALGCYRLARHAEGERKQELNEWGDRLVKWTVEKFRDDDLYMDRLEVDGGRLHRGKLTYNTALMIRSFLALHGRTGKDLYLSEALRSAKAADRFLGRRGAYRDAWKWSHLQVEADLETYRLTGDERYLERAVKTAAAHYERWKERPPKEMIEVASLARELWLLADLETEKGRAFWKEADAW